MGRYITSSDTYYDNELMMLRMGLAKNKREFKWTKENQGVDTWTLDHDAMVRIRVWGGGGGGSGFDEVSSGYATYGGGGGGAGGHGEIILNLVAGSYSLTVGAGGQAYKGATTRPGNGGSSSFSTYITCEGGGGAGRVGTSGYSAAKAPGKGGLVTLSTEAEFLYSRSVRGGDGGCGGELYAYNPGYAMGVNGGKGDSGGYGYMGGGGGGYNSCDSYGAVQGSNGWGGDNSISAGNGGGGYGGGGGGAMSTNSGDVTGGNGAPGIIIIEWN